MRSPLPAPGSRLRPKRDGFALLLTVTLLAFAVLLLVGLATYSRIEMAVAGNMQRQAQARENALMALKVALGKLQESAGPDQRVTATATGSANPYWTGAWKTDPADADYANPKWLVSGLESATAPDPTAALDASDDANVRLVGSKSVSATSEYVVVAKQDIKSPGVPGQSGSATIGRYAWWVGDEGVKAPVAVGDTSVDVTFAPYDSPELQSRIRQQMALGAGAASASDGSAVFEPRDANNTSLVPKVTVPNQLAFLRNASNNAIGLSRVQQNFHAWSPNNFAVIANTKAGGLRQDLSLKPDLLGVPFATWANYASYMEKLKPDSTDGTTGEDSGSSASAATSPAISPAYGDDPLRRRYVMTPHLRTGNSGGSHQVGPVLTYFLLTFNVRTEEGSHADKPLEVRARWMISLWNPYTSAMVPETLQADVTGLPSLEVIDEEPTRAGTIGTVSLVSTFGSPLRINLPWNNTTEGSTNDDRQSWLPGRVYTWRSTEDTSKTTSAAEGFGSDFNSRNLSNAGDGVIRSINGSPMVNGDDPCHIEGSGTGLIQIRLYIVKADGSRVQIGRYTSPQFAPTFTTETQSIYQNGYQFSYVFRLAESFDTPSAPGAWLTGPSRDPRLSRLSSEFFVVGENGDDPAQYANYSKISSPDRLLDRAADSLTYNEDVPVFELPRGPILSLGALQHFRIVGSRPFMIGNSWGSGATLNGNPLGALFDRFYFSGVVDGTTPATSVAGDLILPNPLLKPLRKPDGAKVTLDEFRATATVAPTDTSTGGADAGSESDPSEAPPDSNTTPPDQTDGRSSKFLLQAGAFNLNSTNAAAWAAVLRSVRFPAPQAFSYLDVSADTGTAGDGGKATLSSDDAQFFRFSQSAQETYKAEEGQSAPGESTTPPNTHLFRRGLRTLTGAQVSALAAKIVELMAAKQGAADTAGGPFRSLEEFLAPNALFAGVDADGNAGAPRSLLEAAIADAGINASIAEFSSQWLTQADIMTALAPVLYARSDTFLIRTYGEALNPVTNSIEGRAWCEAMVQRVPDYMDPSDPPETLPAAFDAPGSADDPTSSPTDAHKLNKQLGRRFKVVSFRWLTRSDI